MKRKCNKPSPFWHSKCKQPKSWLDKVDFMAGFVSLGIVCLCAYSLAIVMLLVNSAP
ncbi:hypothetical protein HQ544_03145 [Candidatus Falkowbacteria bacterium]|nr:hypothetical protein [Candidatus Falkowbacteria bacterium]